MAADASLLQPSTRTNSAKKTEKDRRMPKMMKSDSEQTMTMRAAERMGSSALGVIARMLAFPVLPLEGEW